MKENRNETDTIDLLQFVKALWKNLALILLAGIVLAGAFFFYARSFVEPRYEANVLFYVNNSNISIGSTSVSISSGELSAASSLVSTYVAILQSRASMETVIQQSGLEYTYDQLRKMVTASAVNSTGLFQVTVRSSSPEDARVLANTIAEVLPNKISDIVYNSNVKVVDYAITPRTRSAPNYTSYALRGLLIGVVLASAIVVLISFLDTVIRDVDFLRQTYDAPVLATIPDLLARSSGKYGYGYGYYGSSSNLKKKEGD